MTDADRRRDPRFLRRLDLFNRLMRPMLPSASPLAMESSEANTIYLTQLFPMEEIELVLRFVRYRIDHIQDLIQEEPSLYEQYVADYNRFGGARSFLGYEEQSSLRKELMQLRRRAEEWNEELLPLSDAERQRMEELTDLLLADAPLWEGIFPPEPPPEPREAVLPAQASRPPDRQPKKRGGRKSRR